MRYLPASLREKLRLAVQAESTKAAPSTDLWISRPTIPLTTSDFFERQLIGAYTDISSLSIAECHPKANVAATGHYIAFVENGTAKVLYANASAELAEHLWMDTGFFTPAMAVAIAFDGTMPKDTRGRVQFVTETMPWVFWVTADGVLYGQKLGDAAPAALALQNVTAVSAVRAMWSEVGGFDFGLVVFFILSGEMYYRQYIDGAWSDAEPIGFGLDAVYTKIAASRTWDYRIALQAQTADGVLYELFTQFAGIGKQNVEHIELTEVKSQGRIVEVIYHDTTESTHIGVTTVHAVGNRIYGLSSVPIAAANIDDGSGNWGVLVQVMLDYPVTNVSGNQASFVLTDENGVSFTGTSIAASLDGCTLTLGFPDFNSAVGSLTLTYTPGTIQSPAVAMAAFSYVFAPVGLIPPQVDPPALEVIWNE